MQLSIRREMKPLPGQLHSHTDGDVIVVLDLEPDESLLSKRTARELVNRVQKLRKKCNLVPTDTVEMWFDCAAPRERGAQGAANGVARNGAASDGAASNGAGSSAAGNVANGKAGARDAANGAANGSAGAAAADNGGARSNAAEAELCAVVAKERAFLDDALGGCTVLPASRRPRGAVELGREPTTLVLPSDANVDVDVVLTAPAASVSRSALARDFGAVLAAAVDVFVASKGLAQLQEESGGEGGSVEVVLDGERLKLLHGTHVFWRAADVPDDAADVQ